jgi:dinuclear metal center YbgI/SA1388 family protein
LKLAEILDYLDTISPFELQEKWDNSGLIVGDLQSDIKDVVVSIDIDEHLINSASEHTLFITHHPLIFGGLKDLEFSKYPANLIKKLILKEQSLIALHTNFDKTHLNSYVFNEVLGFKLDKKSDFLCQTKEKFDYNELILKVKEAFNLEVIRVVNKKDKINGVALTTGAGASLMDFVDVDCFLTGDIKYHDAIKALNQDLMLIDIGHFESERFFANIMQNLLKTLPISVIISESKNPFTISSFTKDKT